MPSSKVTKVVSFEDFHEENDPCGIYYAPPDRGFFVKAVAKDKVYKNAEGVKERKAEVQSGHVYSDGMEPAPKKIEPVVIQKLEKLQLEAKKEREDDPIPTPPTKAKTKAEKRKAKRKAKREEKRKEREVMEMFRAAQRKYETGKPKSTNKQWRKIKKEQKFNANISEAIRKKVPPGKKLELGLSYSDVLRNATPEHKQVHYVYKTPPTSPKKLPKTHTLKDVLSSDTEDDKEITLSIPQAPDLTRSVSIQDIEDLPASGHKPLDTIEESNVPENKTSDLSYNCDFCNRLHTILSQSIPSDDDPVTQICCNCEQEHLCCVLSLDSVYWCAECDVNSPSNILS